MNISKFENVSSYELSIMINKSDSITNIDELLVFVTNEGILDKLDSFSLVDIAIKSDSITNIDELLVFVTNEGILDKLNHFRLADIAIESESITNIDELLVFVTNEGILDKLNSFGLENIAKKSKILTVDNLDIFNKEISSLGFILNILSRDIEDIVIYTSKYAKGIIFEGNDDVLNSIKVDLGSKINELLLSVDIYNKTINYSNHTIYELLYLYIKEYETYKNLTDRNESEQFNGDLKYKGDNKLNKHLSDTRRFKETRDSIYSIFNNFGLSDLLEYKIGDYNLVNNDIGFKTLIINLLKENYR